MDGTSAYFLPLAHHSCWTLCLTFVTAFSQTISQPKSNDYCRLDTSRHTPELYFLQPLRLQQLVIFSRSHYSVFLPRLVIQCQECVQIAGQAQS